MPAEHHVPMNLADYEAALSAAGLSAPEIEATSDGTVAAETARFGGALTDAEIELISRWFVIGGEVGKIRFVVPGTVDDIVDRIYTEGEGNAPGDPDNLTNRELVLARYDVLVAA